MTRTLYPALTSPPQQPQSGPDIADFALSWSEPVKKKINPVLAIALLASGLFSPPFIEDQSLYPKWGYEWSSPVRIKAALRTAAQQAFTGPVTLVSSETITADKWIYPWSEPVRKKPGIPAFEQQFLASIPFIEDNSLYPKWGYSWSSPVKLAKPGLATPAQQAVTIVPFIEDRNLYPKWGYAWSIPSRLTKPGLLIDLQQFFTRSPFTPTGTTVTVRIAATETNGDVASMAINVYDSGPAVVSLEGAKVSVIELASGGGDPVSIRSG